MRKASSRRDEVVEIRKEGGKTTPCCSKVGIKRGPWTSEEDEILSGYIKREGEGAWRTLPKRAGLLRCGKSCRLRWMNYLRPHLNRSPISPDEEDLILRLHRLLGNRWSLIAGRIPGRTDNEIKNFWNTHLSKKLISQGLDPRTHKPLEVYNPNPTNHSSHQTYNNNTTYHHVRSSPVQDSILDAPIISNPNPIFATNTTMPSPPPPPVLNQLQAYTTTTSGYNNNNNNQNDKIGEAAADGFIVAGYSTSIQGFDSNQGEILDNINCSNDDMFSSFLDSLIMNEECVFHQPNDNHHMFQGQSMMQPILGYGSNSQGFTDHCGSVWGSEISPLMTPSAFNNNQPDQGNYKS